MAKINAKKKGNRGELEMVKILKDHFTEDKGWARVPSSGAWGGGQNRGSREDMSFEQKITLCSDIMTPPSFKFVLEHKFYAEPSFWDLFNESSDLKSWFKQVESDAVFVGKKPLLIVKYNSKKRIVYTKEKLDKYIFEKDGWYCTWLEDLLSKEREFFFDV